MEQEEGPKKIRYSKPKSFANREGKRIGNMLEITSFQKSVQKNPRIKQVQQFLKMLRVEPNACREEIGSTWIELYIMFKKAGFECAVQEPSNEAARKPSMGMHIKEFQRMVREVAQATMSGEDQRIFQASWHKHPRYLGCGIITHMAMINAKVVLEESEEDEITKEVVRSQRRKNRM